MKAACMNAVRNPVDENLWLRCGWMGEVENLSVECPRCLNRGRLAPVIEVSPMEHVK